MNFEPPKLPIAWIASTFILPTLIIVLPYLFSSGDASFTTLLIIALSVLSILLLVVCFALVVRIYSEAYKTQVLELNIKRVEEIIERDGKRIKMLEQKLGNKDR